MVVFWKSLAVKSRNSDEADGDDDATETRLIARGYFVFNADQVEGFDATTEGPTGSLEDLDETLRIGQADAFFRSVGAVVRHGGNKAFYTAGGDFIQMPAFAQFKASEGYYATLAHEHVHWTGAKARLAREFGQRFGDRAYAFEELVAELGAALLCATLGLANEPRPDHAAYIASWLEVLKSDKPAIFTAASKAQAAADYLAGLAAAPQQAEA